MTAQRRRYTAKQKAAAVGIAAVEGVTEASRQTGIPKVNIWQWERKPEYEQLRTNARGPVVEAFWVAIQVGLHEVVKGLKDPDAALNHKAEALKAVTDRYLLLNGEATDRVENVSITDGLDDHERDALNDAIRGELARRSDERAAVPAVGAAGETGAEGPAR